MKEMNDSDREWSMAITRAAAALKVARATAHDLRRQNAACCAENARLREVIARLGAAIAATEAAHEEAVFGDGYTPAIPSPRPLWDPECAGCGYPCTDPDNWDRCPECGEATGIVWDWGRYRAGGRLK